MLKIVNILFADISTFAHQMDILMVGRMCIVGLLILAVSCSDESNSSNSQESAVEQDTNSGEVQQETTPKHALLNTYTFKTGTSLIVVEKKKSASLSLITVQGSGFSNSQQVLTYRDTDPIETAQVDDLDGDGYEEVYIITRSAGSGSYGKIIGVASIQDKTYEPIIFPEPEEGDPNFEGYMGLDRFRFVEGRLMRDIPIYRPGDTNNKPTGGVRVITYDLERTDEGLALVALRSSQY